MIATYEKHFECSNRWILYENPTAKTFDKQYIWTQNFCNDRACPVCTKHRYLTAKKRIKPLVDQINKPKLVTLTVKNMYLTSYDIKQFRNHVRAYFKRLQRHDRKFFGIYVIEFKHQGNRLYHVHVHVVQNLSLHHKTLTQTWSDIVGYEANTDVRYRKTKKQVIKYLALRSSQVGMEMLIEDYLRYVKGKRVINKFGKWFNSSCVQLSYSDNEDKKLRKQGLIFITSIKKIQAQSIIPPEYLERDYIENILTDMY